MFTVQFCWQPQVWVATHFSLGTAENNSARLAMATRAPGSWIWLPDEKDIFVPAKVLTAFKPGEPTKAQSDDGETHALTDTAKIDVCDEQCLDPSIDNLIMVRCPLALPREREHR